MPTPAIRSRTDASTAAEQARFMTKHARRGLTIIELMIVVAIIGILVSVALPAVQDYMLREKVREAVELANPARAALGIACSKGELAGADHESLGLEPGHAYSGEYTSNVDAAGRDSTEATVTVTLRAIDGVIDDGRQIVYTGTCAAGAMGWTVTGDVPPKYLPER